jgi:lipopolysaccharide transport system ATP-binding protein
MNDAIIEVEDLGKRYRIGAVERPRTRAQEIRRLAAAPFGWLARTLRPASDEETLWALRHVSFQVRRGEVVGLIGRNGAGKSTLLKILSRITEPSEGRALLRGRVGSLLEVGTGFHPELTGRENIYLNGAILGMRRAEIAGKFDEIVAFAEVEKFIDTPVKHYSSGMYVRLAFAVAANLESEILVVDEVLAVGDEQFQKKCLGKMENAASSGRTVLFVSHNMAAVRALCPRACWLDLGRIVQTGDAASVVNRYMKAALLEADRPLSDRPDRRGDGSVRFTSITITGMTPSGESAAIAAHDRIRIRLGYRASHAPETLRFLVSLNDYARGGIYFLDSDAAGGFPAPPAMEGTVECTTGPVRISPGQCYVNIAVFSNGRLADHVTYAHSFTVGSAGFDGLSKLPPRENALCVIEQQWRSEAEHGQD